MISFSAASAVAATLTNPDYCQRNNAGTAFLITSGISLVLATILLPLRIYTRVRVVKAFWWDDVCMIGAYLMLVPTYGLLYETAALGLGRRPGCYPPENTLTIGKLQYIAEVLEILSKVLSRCSVALFVIRLFAVTRPVIIFLYTYTSIMSTCLVITAILILLQCHPAEALWDPALTATTQCWSFKARYFVDYFNSAWAILSDILFALLPAYFLRKLQMPRKTKIRLGALMAVGSIPAVCAICRTVYAQNQTAKDTVYSFAILILFGGLETSMLIIAATIPALRPLFHQEHTTKWANPV